MAKVPKELSYKQRASRLRKLKILPTHYKINDLSENDKRHIRRLDNQFSETIKHAKYIKPINVGKSTATKLKQKGFTVKGDYLLVDKIKAKNVTYRKKDNSLVFHFAGRRYVSYPFDDSPQTYARMDSFFATRKKNQFMSIKIGDAPIFHRLTARSEAQLNEYLLQFVPKTKTAFDFMQIVEVDEHHGD